MNITVLIFFILNHSLITVFIFLCNHISGVMVSMLVQSVADLGFIGGVMVSMLVQSVADHGFIDVVMVSMLA